MPRSNASRRVEAIRHQDTRKNIPTEELRDFVAGEERQPKTLLYPRDPSLDPQLVWQGKDEQDHQDLAVPAVPIYIQEKIHPQAIIDDLLAHAAQRQGIADQEEPYQLNMFSDFNGLPEEFDQRVDFYQHEGHWSNRMILGDSLMVMASLAEKEGLKGQVQMIYIDPPYGIKFGSNWQVSTRKRDVKDGKSEDLTRQPEQVRAFRDTWQLGIHSYLAYLRDRLVIARELLTETGSVFVQIGDENVHLVRSLLDEVFGSENFISEILFSKKNMPLSGSFLFDPCDYILWYSKNKESTKYRKLFLERIIDESTLYNWGEFKDGTKRSLSKLELENIQNVKNLDKTFLPMDMRSSGYAGSMIFPVEIDGDTFYPTQGKSWKTTRDGVDKLKIARRLFGQAKTLRYILYFEDYPVSELKNIWLDTRGEVNASYVVQTSSKVIERCVLLSTDPGDLVFDPTCGSGTTAYVAEQWGRRWITIDTSRVALALARNRLLSARFPYYYLADDYPQMCIAKTENETRSLLRTLQPDLKSNQDIKKGFIYKKVPHITLGSIANNPDIYEGMSKDEIEEAIARHADSEILYDQPFEDSRTVRVSGPFTVESLSPHRVLSTADENMDGLVTKEETQREQDFSAMILDNLKAVGVQNTIKNERIKFDMLEPFPGRWLHAKGEYTDAEGLSRRVAVSIGPEHGTVGPQQVKEAAKEAVQGVGFDVLLVCGFAFDPHVAEEAKRYGDLIVLPTRMNPDLSMGEDLLKKTGAGNLFMVFGEPDIDLREDGDRLVVEVKGVDIYDPTTGEIRSSSPDEIACWFIDTEYNSESFFVRHAYFTGADQPYDKLKRALRAEIDEDAWSTLYSTISRPFPHPASGKIAVKVINHYGDEVLKVFEV